MCTCKFKPRMKKILPHDNNDAVICYPNCPRVLFTSAMRQRVSNEKGKPNAISEDRIKHYHQFLDKYFEEQIIPILQEFNYNVEAWMNSLDTLEKQKEVLKWYQDYKYNNKKLGLEVLKECLKYDLFTKEEKQATTINEDGSISYPKCRAISSCPPILKWVMGPVIKALEKLFGRKLKGYKFNDGETSFKSWSDIEQYYDRNDADGFTEYNDADGSRWDTTMRIWMNHIFKLIINWLVDNHKIYHVDGELFRQASTPDYRSLTAKVYIDGRSYTLISMLIYATMFSGSPNTIFTNTVINATLNAYIFEGVLGYTADEYKSNCSGDDNQSSVRPGDSQRIRDTFIKVWTELGLVPKYFNTGDTSVITFCSTNVVKYFEDGQYKHKILRIPNRLNPLSHYSISALHYFAGEMKTHYEELAIGMLSWAKNIPYYENYIKAFQYHADQIKSEKKKIPEGKAKMTFDTDEVYENCNYEKVKTLERCSNRVPPEHVIYDFLYEKYNITKTDIIKQEELLRKYVNYTV